MSIIPIAWNFSCGTAIPAKKNHEPQNGAKERSPGEGGPEGATRPWVKDELAGIAACGMCCPNYKKQDVVMASSQNNVWSYLKEGLLFLWRFIHQPSSVGAILPSSDRLARALVSQIPQTSSSQKRYILEVGPGTGVVSEKILRCIRPQDELHLVEFDRDFCAQLREKFAKVDNIKIYEGSITDFDPEKDMHLPPDQKYDAIISSLPFNAFDQQTVDTILSKYEHLVREGGGVSYFEYLFLPTISKLFVEKVKAHQLDQLLELKDKFYRKHGNTKQSVWVNMPPAQIVHHTIHKNSRI